MPPRRAKRKKSSTSTTTNAYAPIDHELPKTPEVKIGAELADDLKIEEPATEILDQVQVSNPNFAEIDGELENCDVNEDGEPVIDEKIKEDLQEIENVDEEKSKLETVAEINSAQEEINGGQVDDFKILNDNNNPLVVEGNDDEEKEDIAEIISIQESNISKSPCKNNDALVVEGTSKIVSIQESCENNTALTVKDDFNANGDDEQSDDGIQGDDANNEGNEEPSLFDNKKDNNIEIYVGKLDSDTVEDDLVKVFQQFGELKSTRIVRRVRRLNSKKNKGYAAYAFIRFATVDQAKWALSELKDGVEVRGKRVMVSARQDNRTLYLENILKTWKKEEVVQQLKHYGIEHIETISIPEDPNIEGKLRGFAILEFTTRVTAETAFQRLQKPDVVFGLDISAKVAFTQSSDEDLSQVNRVHVEGLTKDFTEEKVKEICKKYGEIVEIKLCRSTRTKKKDFGFITFSSPESALACVEGINNNTAIGGEAKIKASIAKPQQRNRWKKRGFRGGFKVEKPSDVSTLNKEGDVSNKNSEPKSSKMKGVLNTTQQTQTNKKDSSKNKVNKAKTVNKPQQKGSLGESSKQAELIKMKGDLNSQKAPKNKRKASSDQKLNNRDQGASKKPKSGGGEGQNSKTAFKAGKRKKASVYEAREDRGHGKKPFKKQKGNMYGRERDNSRNPQNNTHIIRGHNDSRNTTRYVVPYAPKYAASASDAYHLAPDHSLATRRYMEMEPHAGYIEPASAKQSQSYSGFTHSQQHQTVYLAPASASQSQLYSRHLDRSALTHSHQVYNGTAVIPEVQPYRDYRQPQPAVVHIARDPYESGLARGARVVTYAGGPPLAASQVRDHTSYYQGGGSYSGAHTSRQTYY